MKFLSLTTLALVAATVSSALTNHEKNLREVEVLQANADTAVQANQCSNPPIAFDSPTAKTDCGARKRKYASGGCHLCGAGKFDERLTEVVNVCVADKKHCIAPPVKNAEKKPVHWCAKETLAGCALKLDGRVTRPIARLEENKKSKKSELKFVIGLESVKKYTTTAKAKFLHCTTAVDKIVESQKLLASRGGSSGGANSRHASTNCKGFVYLWPVDPNAKEGALRTMTKKIINNVKVTMKETLRRGQTLEAVLLTVPAGFEVEYDPDEHTAVRHKGEIVAGDGITIAKQETTEIDEDDEDDEE